MNRFRFKFIAILIPIALAGLIAFQGYWLKGLYNTLYNQMETNIQESMRIADYKELLFRMEEYKQQTGAAEYVASVNYSNQEEAGDEEQDSEIPREIDDFEINVRGTDLKNEVDKALDELLTTLNNMESIVLQGMHDQFDSIMPIRFHVYDSLLVDELKNRGIDTEMQHVACYISNNRTSYQLLGETHPDSLLAPFDWKKARYYDYPIRINPLHTEDISLEREEEAEEAFLSYRLYIKSPARIILHQMIGILSSSFLVLVIIIITFIYLLRTILKQKTEEELKTDFTNNMTHELKTPISISYAAIDSMLNFSETVDEKQRKYLTIVREQLTHLTGLVEQILSLSVENRNTFRLHPEPVNLLAQVQILIEQNKLQAGKQVLFTTEIAENLEVVADKTHLYNMLNNLIENAIKYAGKEPCRILLKAEKHSGEVNISVTDNGPGISIAHQSRIFDRFYRIPSGDIHNAKGHGLGLYYVKDMINKHGGEISVKSAIGKGTTFTLHFKTGR